MKVKVVIAEAHFLVRESLATYLKIDPEIEVLGTAVNGLEAVNKVRELKPQVVLMDLKMPVMDGLEATRLIKQEVPEIRVIILSFSLDHIMTLKSIGSQADDYIVKGSDSDTLRHKIKASFSLT